jgi:hypothetical protein
MAPSLKSHGTVVQQKPLTSSFSVLYEARRICTENHGQLFSGALPPLIEAVRFCGMKRSRVLLARPGRRTVNMPQATLPMYLPRLAAYLENSCNYRTSKED